METTYEHQSGPVRVTLSDVQTLPPTLSVWSRSEPSAASLLGVGRAQAYAMAQRGDLPILRVGPGRIVVPTMRLLRLLGMELVQIHEHVDEQPNENAS